LSDARSYARGERLKGGEGMERGQGKLRGVWRGGQVRGGGKGAILMRGLMLVVVRRLAAAIIMNDRRQRGRADHQGMGIGHPAGRQHRAHQKRDDGQMAKAARNPLHGPNLRRCPRPGQAPLLSQPPPEGAVCRT